jgi:DNA replication and repair protein RecF
MKQFTGEMPLLLLDDVMSELDAHRRQQIINIVDQAGQAIITTTDWDDFPADFRERAKLLSVNMGRIEEIA